MASFSYDAFDETSFSELAFFMDVVVEVQELVLRTGSGEEDWNAILKERLRHEDEDVIALLIASIRSGVI